jgi:4-methyl-5(b-hydroxyethyl)-thiazole monophosphate biosynthesis
MASPSVLIVLAEGFEEIEAVTPIDLLRRAGASVTVAALSQGTHVQGRSGLVLHADTTLSSVEADPFDWLVIPGGPGVGLLRADERMLRMVREQRRAGRWIAAICAAPLVLLSAGVLHGRRHTCHFSAARELPEADLTSRVEADGKLITSRGAGTALDFSLLIIEKMFSAAKSLEVAASIAA